MDVIYSTCFCHLPCLMWATFVAQLTSKPYSTAMCSRALGLLLQSSRAWRLVITVVTCVETCYYSRHVQWDLLQSSRAWGLLLLSSRAWGLLLLQSSRAVGLLSLQSSRAWGLVITVTCTGTVTTVVTCTWTVITVTCMGTCYYGCHMHGDCCY